MKLGFLKNNLRDYGLLLSLVAIMGFFQFQTDGVLMPTESLRLALPATHPLAAPHYEAVRSGIRLAAAAGEPFITMQATSSLRKLGDDLPKRGDPDAILVVHGAGSDDDVHAVLLFAADYMQDDLAGERHTSTAIAAEQKLELATRDVLRRAEKESWP